jgi:hypothetical protein
MSDGRAAKVGTGFERLLTPKEAIQFLRVSKLVLACQNAHARGRTAVPKSSAAPYATRRQASSSG